MKMFLSHRQMKPCTKHCARCFRKFSIKTCKKDNLLSRAQGQRFAIDHNQLMIDLLLIVGHLRSHYHRARGGFSRSPCGTHTRIDHATHLRPGRQRLGPGNGCRSVHCAPTTYNNNRSAMYAVLFVNVFMHTHTHTHTDTYTERKRLNILSAALLGAAVCFIQLPVQSVIY